VKFLVDANVLSEPTRAAPDARVVAWLRDHERDLAIDPVILGELRYGILLLPAGRRRTRLRQWFDAGIRQIQCVPWDASVGLRWAELLARLRRSGKPMPVKDSLIAATALVHELTVVSRNVSDFEKAAVPVFDPFAQ
jgi:predicted nucleic acid-binding protein